MHELRLFSRAGAFLVAGAIFVLVVGPFE